MKKFGILVLFAAGAGLFLGIAFLYIQSSQVQSPPSLERLIQDQNIGLAIVNPIKYSIRSALSVGVPANTLVLLLLLPVVASFITAARNIGGLRGFGIFLPASLSVVFVAMGPIVGIGLFLLIVFVSTFTRLALSQVKIRLQYLPRMAFILWAVVVAILFLLLLAPAFDFLGLAKFEIFPVLILILLAEDFIRVQIGKSAKIAVHLATETLILAFISYLVLTFRPLQEFAILNPEILLISVAIFDFLLGKFVGLRFLEYWRFRKLIES